MLRLSAKIINSWLLFLFHLLCLCLLFARLFFSFFIHKNIRNQYKTIFMPRWLMADTFSLALSLALGLSCTPTTVISEMAVCLRCARTPVRNERRWRNVMKNSVILPKGNKKKTSKASQIFRAPTDNVMPWKLSAEKVLHAPSAACRGSQLWSNLSNIAKSA